MLVRPHNSSIHIYICNYTHTVAQKLIGKMMGAGRANSRSFLLFFNVLGFRLEMPAWHNRARLKRKDLGCD